MVALAKFGSIWEGQNRVIHFLIFRTFDLRFTLSQVKSNLVPLSLLTDEEIRDSLKDFLTVKDLSKIKENTEEKSEFSRLMKILEEVC